MTFVRTNSAGSRIERSTWLSVAKWTIARGLHCRRSPPIASPLQISICSMKTVASFDRREVLAISRIGQFVNDEKWLEGFGEPIENKIGADETSPARHKDHFSPAQRQQRTVPMCTRNGVGGCGNTLGFFD